MYAYDGGYKAIIVESFHVDEKMIEIDRVVLKCGLELGQFNR